MFLEKMKKNKGTAQYQLTKRFISIFLGVLLAMNLIYLIAASGFVYEFVEDKAKVTLSILENEVGREPDWKRQVDTVVSQKEEDALIIETENGEIFFSAEGQDVFEDVYEGKSLPFVKSIVFSDEGIFYVTTKDYGEFTAHVAISAEIAAELVSGMLLISLLLNVIAIVLGSLIIHRSVKNWSKTLKKMSQEIKELDMIHSNSITVPNNPKEITEVATAFNQLLGEQQEAIERERQFVTNASHDLKTPIAAIRGHVKLIKRRGETHPEVIPKSLDFIDKESLRLEKLSHQLLLLDQRKDKVSKEKLDLSELVLDEIERSQTLNNREFISLIEEKIVIEGIRSDFQQIFQNLIENAIKYSFEHTPVQITLKEEGKSIIFTVTDEGVGIDDKEKRRVFERFYRADDSRTSKIEGSGIGLAIVRKILESYDGTIEIKDNLPRGAIFIMTVPK